MASIIIALLVGIFLGASVVNPLARWLGKKVDKPFQRISDRISRL